METVKKIIEVTVRDRVATHVGDDFYVCGNTGYEIHFDFDEEWDALDVKTARFIGEGNVVYPDRIFSGNICSFPDNPPISNTSNIRVGVFAGNLQTTTPARIPAAKSILCGTSTPAAPDDDAYHEAMEEMAKVATEARTKAAESAQSAEASAQSAVEAAASAEDSARAAKTAGQHSANADTKAKEAQGHAAAAAKSASDAATSAANAEKAEEAAIANADDAEASAKDAKEWANDAEVHASNAETSASNAEASANASAAAAQEARNTAEAMTQDVLGSDGRGGLYLVGCYGNSANRTQEEVRAAASAGKTIFAVDVKKIVYNYIGERPANRDGGANAPTFFGYMECPEIGTIKYCQGQILADGTWTRTTIDAVKAPAPYSLKLRGAVSATYDGSEDVTVTIPTIAGPQGPQGEAGPAGADGYSPVRGTDYWTAEDIASIKAYVDDAILNGAW